MRRIREGNREKKVGKKRKKNRERENDYMLIFVYVQTIPHRRTVISAVQSLHDPSYFPS